MKFYVLEFFLLWRSFWGKNSFLNFFQISRRAVEYFDDEKLELEVPIDRFSLEPELQELLQDRLKTFNNLAQAQMKLESWEAALASLKNVLKVEVSLTLLFLSGKS